MELYSGAGLAPRQSCQHPAHTHGGASAFLLLPTCTCCPPAPAARLRLLPGCRRLLPAARMSRVVCRRGVARGATSAAFSADDLLAALQGDPAEYVWCEPDGAGALAAAGGAGPARLAVSARLAPSRPAASAELRLGPAGLRLATTRALAPHDELLLWFGDAALGALGVPHLTPQDVRAGAYKCRACPAAFADPNPLKLHLFLRCAPPEPRRFWREAAARLRALAPPASGPAELEALAAAWRRVRAGHVCVFCGKLYSRRYGLKIHLRTHTGYRPLRCRHCARAFGDPSNLNKHVRLHQRAEPAAPYQCAACGRVLARRRDLERHARSHLPAAPPTLLPARLEDGK